MRRLAAYLGVGAGLLLLGLVVAAPPAAAVPQDKVTICHADSSVEHPYVEETVDVDSIVLPDGTPTGHGLHTGPIFPEPDWGDIIPSLEYTNSSGGTSIYPGLNATADGLAILEAGCEVIFEQPKEPPTTTVPPTSTPTTFSSTTTAPPATGTTVPSETTAPSESTVPGESTVPAETTVPGETTTTPPTPAPPTTAPPSEIPPQPVDPPGGAEIVPPEDAAVVDPGDQVKDLGPVPPSEREEQESELDPQTGLATTGHNDAGAAALGLGVFLTGLGLIALVGWRRWESGD